MKKTYPMYLHLILCWGVTLTFALSKTNDYIEVIGFPPLNNPKTGERVFIHIQVTNKSDEVVRVTNGKKQLSGVITPYSYGVKWRFYKGGDGHYISTGGRINFKNRTDGNRRINLKPGDKVIFRIELTPFTERIDADFCHLTISLNISGLEKQGIDCLMPSLVLVKERKGRGEQRGSSP